MNSKNKFLKRVYVVSSFLLVAALLLTGCTGAFSFDGSAAPNAEGGVDVSGDVQPLVPQADTAVQPAESTGLSTTTIILIVVGIALFILVLVLVVSRGHSNSEPRA